MLKSLNFRANSLTPMQNSIPKYYYLLTIYCCFILINLLFPKITNAQNQQSQAWKLVKNDNNIKIYNRNYSQTQFKEYQAIMVIKSSLKNCIALIKDDNAAKSWINRIKEFRTIKVISPQEWFTYTEISLPFPFQNRDLISHNKISNLSLDNVLVGNYKAEIIKIELLSVPDFIPENTDKVRMKKSHGFWQFRQLPNQEIEVIYHFFSEPVIALPQWFVEPFIIKGIHTTLTKMREVVKKYEL
jgi:hypothetical protein